MRLTARDLEKIPHREFRGRDLHARMTVKGVSTDSRTTRPGELFVALRGGSFDGHAFVSAAFARGAVGAVVDEVPPALEGTSRPLLVVGDTLEALGALARAYRDRFSIPFLAVAGSNGKTTTKEMIAGVLRRKYNVLSTEGNLNNGIGVPMTLFRLNRKHEVAVIEIGTNHPGEIAGLCRTLDPTHGLITSIGREHLEFFGSLEGVAEEEGELFRFLSVRSGGTVIAGVDDPRIARAASPVKRALTYAFQARSASLRGRAVAIDEGGRASFEFRSARMKRWHRVHLAIPGKHNAMNALAAAAAGVAFHVPAAEICSALEACRIVGRRMETSSIGGVTVLNDTYNANPDSTVAALETLASVRAKGKKIAVLADMKELGPRAAEGHAEVGKKAAELAIDMLLTYGELARGIHDAAGMPGALHFEKKEALEEHLADTVAPGDALLVKGSRGMHMEDVIAFLKNRLEAA